ncbi:DUF2125 domain-containing protein [Tateyamaria omphalii]|uniref:DUF2125 domain-containing protein n=1 Tax=Tateyamaria omphalii TaxID=299262 RepID=UPI001C992761|nr:DUF2125 domain-containing protein [Tateyamaria omphalii]MBY5933268.1 DUF2125 domain-containing protein [Tateyamaria omphalii]
MSRISHLISGTALALCLPASAALADLTAEQVWSDWQSYMESTGYSVTASEAIGSGSVEVSNMTLTVEMDDDAGGGAFKVVLDSINFVEQGDGTVAIELPDTTEMNMTFQPETGETVTAVIDFTQTAPDMVAAGDPGDLTYTYAAEAAAMALQSVTIDGVSVGPEIAKIDIRMTDLAQTMKTTVGDLRTMAQDMTVAKVDYDMAFNDPESEDTFTLKGTMNGLTLNGTGDLPLDTDVQDVNAMLNDGFKAVAAFTTNGGNYDMSFSSETDGSGTANATSTGAAFDVSFGPEGLLYDVSQTGVDMNMLMTELPLPISFSAAEIGTRFLMPLQKSNEEQDFGLAVTLSQFVMSDMLWSLFDPTSQLPRDPATLLVDLSGKAKVLFDFLDPAQAEVLEQADAVPGELNALTINKIEVDAVGAKLTGAGDFVFDNNDLQTFDGMPRPEGAVDLTLVGGNGLLDKLVGMGLLPEDQAMGARMMMGLFAVPGEGEDTLNSKIEVNGEGHVLANGQRIR